MNATNPPRPNLPRPVAALRGAGTYAPPRSACPVDLRLDSNEGRLPAPELLASLPAAGPETVRRYPDRGVLESRLAERFACRADEVLVTAGADEAIDRICRAYLDASRELIVATPTFEMIPRYAGLAGAVVREVPWTGGAFPTAAVCERCTAATGVIAVVSPNNPTGAVATPDDLRQLAAAAPAALLLVDLAYGEFATEDLMPVVRELPNAVAVGTFSKAWGLAGLRVGYAVGPAALLAPLRGAGGPYAVSGASLVLALAALADEPAVAGFVSRVRHERAELARLLTDLGAEVEPSQGNFVYLRCADPLWLRDGLAGLGIAVRLFATGAAPAAIRITCPGNEPDFERLCVALRAVLKPDALLLDMDGVLADVSVSYRACIQETAASYGVALSAAEVAAAKRRPGSNNDWVLTRDLLAARGVDVPLPEIVERFQARYLELAPGEGLIPSRELLSGLADRLPLGIVTGRPRRDAEAFLERFCLTDLFSVLVAMEDAPGKPDPAPVRLALQQLGAEAAWLVGDTVNDIAAARAAGAMPDSVVPLGVVPLGVVPPGEESADYASHLIAAGAGRVLNDLTILQEALSS